MTSIENLLVILKEKYDIEYNNIGDIFGLNKTIFYSFVDITELHKKLNRIKGYEKSSKKDNNYDCFVEDLLVLIESSQTNAFNLKKQIKDTYNFLEMLIEKENIDISKYTKNKTIDKNIWEQARRKEKIEKIIKKKRD